jgi:hypothetical protein
MCIFWLSFSLITWLINVLSLHERVLSHFIHFDPMDQVGQQEQRQRALEATRA